MKARIYKPSQTAMQSGMRKTDEWVLEYISDASRTAEPLMGWVQSSDTLEQVKLTFESLNKAQAFADKKGLDYIIATAQNKKIKPRNYGDNFVYRGDER